jgi:hypothetical protein
MLVLCFSSWSLWAVAADTVLKLYRPYGAVLEQMIPVAKKQLLGQCDGPSKVVVREDAWRCLAEGQVFDPCFVERTKRTKVLCPKSPWTNDGVQINLDSELTEEELPTLDMSRNFPWAVELVSGERCQAIDTKEQYDSLPIRYHCTKGSKLMGYLQRCKPVWSMLEQTPSGVITAEFKKAWF